jgi:hypothetical protein
MSRRLLRALALAMAAGLALGCGRGSSPSDTSGPDIVIIATIAPPDGTVLAPGGKVTFDAGISYLLNSAGAAAIVMTVEDQSGRVLNPDSEVTTIVSRGTGSVRFTDQVTVPATGASTVRVLFTLSPTPPVSPPVLASASYPVGR